MTPRQALVRIGAKVVLRHGRYVTFQLAEVAVIGETVAQTFDHLYHIERACKAQVNAMSTGRSLVDSHEACGAE